MNEISSSLQGMLIVRHDTHCIVNTRRSQIALSRLLTHPKKEAIHVASNHTRAQELPHPTPGPDRLLPAPIRRRGNQFRWQQRRLIDWCQGRHRTLAALSVTSFGRGERRVVSAGSHRLTARLIGPVSARYSSQIVSITAILASPRVLLAPAPRHSLPSSHIPLSYAGARPCRA